MKKAVLISIKPKWCELIASGEKTIEIRKTKPKIETPFKVYIYCTKPKEYFSLGGGLYACSDLLYRVNGKICCGDGSEHYNNEIQGLNGKVIGEFVCDYIETFGDDAIHSFSNEEYSQWNDFDLNRACIHPQDFEEYANDSLLYGWHISHLKIYGEPKELREFEIKKDCGGYIKWHRLSRPPQSWCYVEEVTE